MSLVRPHRPILCALISPLKQNNQQEEIKMKSSISQSNIVITGSLKEELKIISTYEGMLKDFNSMCVVEHFGANTSNEIVEVTLCYSSSEATVKTIRESYSEAKKAA